MLEEVQTSTSLPDELLYGRVGYLAALLYLRRELAQSLPPGVEDAMRTVRLYDGAGKVTTTPMAFKLLYWCCKVGWKASGAMFCLCQGSRHLRRNSRLL